MGDHDCPECGSGNVDRATVDAGRVGVYCWECETLYIDPSIVYGSVEVR